MSTVSRVPHSSFPPPTRGALHLIVFVESQHADFNDLPPEASLSLQALRERDSGIGRRCPTRFSRSTIR